MYNMLNSCRFILARRRKGNRMKNHTPRYKSSRSVMVCYAKSVVVVEGV